VRQYIQETELTKLVSGTPGPLQRSHQYRADEQDDSTSSNSNAASLNREPSASGLSRRRGPGTSSSTGAPAQDGNTGRGVEQAKDE
jgi:hypothetical protein